MGMRTPVTGVFSMELSERDGGTRMEMRSVFDSREQMDQVLPTLAEGDKPWIVDRLLQISLGKGIDFRFNSVVQRFDVVGVRALGIIGLMSFLIGIVIAQQGAVQLAQFGAEVYTINLIGRITIRELGVLMTAIMVAGRSGSAFAAQIGTMKITEEIDAMRTIGVSPIEALVIPRIIAAVLMMPLLAFWAMLMALLGGGIERGSSTLVIGPAVIGAVGAAAASLGAGAAADFRAALPSVPNRCCG